jgi:BirA family biotin operon repressor/biotin-[acetyl-CoA-carboxylase] ligase
LNNAGHRHFNVEGFQRERRGAWGSDLRWRERLGSTQDAAAQALEAGAGEGCVVLAEAQDAGRGRWGKHWEGRPGLSLLFTVLVDAAPAGPGSSAPQNLGQLSLVLGLATAQALRGLGLADADCKWPNDVWWRGRKLGGLLVEGRGQCLLAGCGLNVGQATDDFPPELRTSAASLAQAGLSASRETVLAAVLGAWEAVVGRWRAEGWAVLAADWPACDALAGQRCRLQSGGRSYEGRVLGLAPDGALRLALDQGSSMDFHSAEVEHLRPVEAGPGHKSERRQHG